MGFLRVCLAVTTVVLRSRRSAGCGAGAAEAPMEVDPAGVLEADVSRSIDEGEFVLGICLRERWKQRLLSTR